MALRPPPRPARPPSPARLRCSAAETGASARPPPAWKEDWWWWVIGVDSITLDYVKKHSNLSNAMHSKANEYWLTLRSDDGANFDKKIIIDVSQIKPQVTWGTSPEMTIDFDADIPSAKDISEENQENMSLAKAYMGLEKSKTLQELSFDRIFIGSCTNSRIEDLRDAASVIKGQKVSKDITEAIVVPGSGMVKAQAEEEGLDTIFMEAGFLWRDPGCSMCLGMNPDQLKPYERCASTSNRNFEGRQGNLGRTHLMSPLMAALTAVNGKITDPS